MNFCVVTTINFPTKAIEKLHEHFGDNLIVVADEKTPKDWNYKGVVPIEGSCMLYSPRNHYARKNLGYLEAIKKGAKLIYSTDDDNIPNSKWQLRNISVRASESVGTGWYNVYDILSKEFIWPRGFSLRHLNDYTKLGGGNNFQSSIQQGLADGEPDVDAIWRITMGRQHEFEKIKSIYLKKDSWCPFNTQSTWFFPKAFPLMYLPITCSMRCTDIWSGFIAQRILWEINEGVTFHSPSEVFQDRNEHDLLKDFEDEIDGYLKNDMIVETLSELQLKSGEENICDNLLTCYEVLTEKGVFKSEEINSVKQWIEDYEYIKTNMATVS